MLTTRVGRLMVTLVAITLLAACGEPPDKEMHQAQGAIDAARAAGADQYATDELRAAAEALARAQEAVQQHDYRLALNHALDSRERAQNAAKEAADQKAIVRSEAERALTQTVAVLAQSNTRLRAAQAIKPRPRLPDATDRITRAEQGVQKARAALSAERYLDARKSLADAAVDAEAALAEIDAAIAATHPPRRRR